MSQQGISAAALAASTGAAAMRGGTESCLATQPDLAVSAEPNFAGALFRLTKPGIVLAEVLAGLAGMLLARPGAAAVNCPLLLALALAAGGAAMLNGLLDAALDRQMLRLADRCRALKVVGRGRLLAISLCLMASGLTLAALTVPRHSVLLLAAGCLSYLWPYTAWLKRRSPWGVLAGAVPGALPPLIGATAVSTGIAAPALLLALLVFIWQLPHFWFLALNYRTQYAQAGIPVLPLTHGTKLTGALTLAAALLLLPVSLFLGRSASLSAVYFLIAGGVGGGFVFFCARALFRTHSYRRGFIASLVYLLTVIAAICGELILVAR